jgi:hypothetical protein
MPIDAATALVSAQPVYTTLHGLLPHCDECQRRPDADRQSQTERAAVQSASFSGRAAAAITQGVSERALQLWKLI